MKCIIIRGVLKILKYSGLFPFSVFHRCHFHQAGRTPALQQNWQSSERSQNFKEKTQYLMNTLYNSININWLNLVGIQTINYATSYGFSEPLSLSGLSMLLTDWSTYWQNPKTQFNTTSSVIYWFFFHTVPIWSSFVNVFYLLILEGDSVRASTIRKVSWYDLISIRPTENLLTGI